MLKHPYYAQDSSLALQLIETIHGHIEYRVNCKKYDEGYLVKGIDLTYDENTGSWVKPTSENKVFDHELSIEVIKTRNLLHGIVKIVDGIETKGYYSPNVYKNCLTYSQEGNGRCMDFTILTPDLYTEQLSTGVFYKNKGYSTSNIKELSTKGLSINNSNNSYNIEDNKESFKNAINTYENSKFPIDNDIAAVAPYIKGITFGMEIETINGTLPLYLLAKYGIIICKDGSIKSESGMYPPEYVTVPLSGAKGLQTIRNVSAEIAKRSDIDIKCSLHMHIGGMEISRVFLVSLFRLCYKIQNDIFKMFPYYKTDPTGIKDKNYCKKLPNILNIFNGKDFEPYINGCFTDLFTFLSGGLKAEEVVKHGSIKSLKVPWGGHKWDCKTRYFWINFINPIFGKRDTIEFRIHTPTTNPDKIINWLLMCIAVVRFAEDNVDHCIKLNKISFAEVLDYYGDTFATSYTKGLSQNLKDYYNHRVEYFEQDFKNKDYISKAELKEDESFTFNTLKTK